jgi:hypothetical protein
MIGAGVAIGIRGNRDELSVLLRSLQAAARAAANCSAAKSRSATECAADICVRIRAVPRGTTGKEKLTA